MREGDGLMAYIQKRTLDEQLALALPECEVKFNVRTSDGDIVLGELVTIGVTNEELVFLVEIP